MKFGTDYKIIAFVNETKKIATIALKKKNGILSTHSDTQVNGKSSIMTLYLGSAFVQVGFKKRGKKWDVKITFPGSARDEMNFVAKTASQFNQFIETDYTGFKIHNQ